jgi:ribosomal protein S18 acetylase RimI-like enzyme
MVIRLFEPRDRDAVWGIMEDVIRDGETCAIPMEATREEALAFWIDRMQATYVAEIDGAVVGTYYLKPNQVGNGGHVCNAGYIVGSAGRGQGVATAMCAHSLEEARRRGYLAMQFNLVIETNETAVRLWRKMGFEILTTVPRAFRHPTQGLVGAHVMWKWLGGD